MSSGPAVIPDAVYTVWWIGLLLTLVVFAPIAVYSLHCTWRSARSVQRYAAEARQAVAAIERNTRTISTLDDSITIATDLLGAAGAVERKVDTVASVLVERGR